MTHRSETFKDHFSGHAADYALYRPSYPGSLFSWLAGVSTTRTRAWDCATGNGQAAICLSEYFDEVIATDASSEQICQANPHPRISYRVERAEQTTIGDGSVDLVTVGQAYHWFDHAAFHAEADRVLKPGGVLVIWTYMLATIGREIDELVFRLYGDIVGDYWPPERKFIDRGYRDFNLPWPEMPVPGFSMQARWNLDSLLGYLGTWSALRRYVRDKGTDPLDLVHGELLEAWGDPEQEKVVTWPLIIKAGRKPV